MLGEVTVLSYTKDSMKLRDHEMRNFQEPRREKQIRAIIFSTSMLSSTVQYTKKGGEKRRQSRLLRAEGGKERKISG